MGRVTGLVRCVNETRIGRPAPRRRVATDGQALAAKRRLKHHYGICEQQLLRYVELARGRPGGAGEALVLLCERRLDTVVRLAGFVPARPLARLAVVHGHVLVNGRKVTRPGYLVRAGDVIAVRPRPHIEALYRPRLAAAEPAPAWLAVEPPRLRATVARLPTAADVAPVVDVDGVIAFLTR